MTAQKDIWNRIELGLRAKGLNKFQVRKVKGHAKQENTQKGIIIEGEDYFNGKADGLAILDAEQDRHHISTRKTFQGHLHRQCLSRLHNRWC